MTANLTDLRPEVRAFAIEMERRLREDDFEGNPGWKKDSALDLAYHMRDGAFDLFDLVYTRNNNPAVNYNRTEIYNAAADVANMAMMVMDVCGGFASTQEETP